MQAEVQKLPEQSRDEPSHNNSLHLLRASLRNTQCINDPSHSVLLPDPGLNLPEKLVVHAWPHGGGELSTAANP